MNEVERGGLEPREREVKRVARERGGGQLIGVRIPLIGEAIHRRTAGVGHPDHAPDLVKGFARRVVARRADLVEGRIAVHDVKRGVPAREHHAEKGGRKVGIRCVGGGNVRAHMIHADQRNAVCHGE